MELGYLQLCTAYVKKTHSQVTPVVVNILKHEKDNREIEEDRAGWLYTNAPQDLVKMLSESFEVVLAKRAKELVLRTLRMFFNMMQQYQRALARVLEADAKLPHDFLIAQCNNCFLYFE